MQYDEDVAEKIPKWSTRLTIQMKSQTFDAETSIKMLRSLSNFKLACHTNSVHEGAAMWILDPFMKKPASAVLNAWICLKMKKKRCQAGRTLTTYCEVVNYMLSHYAIDFVLAKTDAEMTMSKQPSK